MVDVSSCINRNEKKLQELKKHWKIFFSAKSICTFSILPIIEVNTNRVVVTDKRIFGVSTDIHGNIKNVDECTINQINDISFNPCKIDGCASMKITLKNGDTKEFRDLEICKDKIEGIYSLFSKQNVLNQMFR